jgi:hypothetical protein
MAMDRAARELVVTSKWALDLVLRFEERRSNYLGRGAVGQPFRIAQDSNFPFTQSLGGRTIGR